MGAAVYHHTPNVGLAESAPRPHRSACGPHNSSRPTGCRRPGNYTSMPRQVCTSNTSLAVKTARGSRWGSLPQTAIEFLLPQLKAFSRSTSG